MVLIVSHSVGYSRFTNGPPFVCPRFTSVSCGDEGWVSISVRRRASDGSCGRVMSVFVSFFGFRCVAEIVSVW